MSPLARQCFWSLSTLAFSGAGILLSPQTTCPLIVPHCALACAAARRNTAPARTAVRSALVERCFTMHYLQRPPGGGSRSGSARRGQVPDGPRLLERDGPTCSHGHYSDRGSGARVGRLTSIAAPLSPRRGPSFS